MADRSRRREEAQVFTEMRGLVFRLLTSAATLSFALEVYTQLLASAFCLRLGPATLFRLLQTKFNRREFLAVTALTPMAACVSCRLSVDGRQTRAGRLPRFFFISQGRTGLINADGTGLRYLEFDVPNQA